MAIDLNSNITRLKIFNILLSSVVMILGYVSFYKEIEEDKYFVGVMTISCILNVLSLLFMGYKQQEKKLHYLDAGNHGIFAVLVIVAGIIYITKTTEINEFLQKLYHYPSGKLLVSHDERMAAGSLAIIQGILYLPTAYIIWKNSKDQTSTPWTPNPA